MSGPKGAAPADTAGDAPDNTPDDTACDMSDDTPGDDEAGGAGGAPLGDPTQGSILLVEDSRDDIELLQRAFRKAGVRRALEVVTHGDAALDTLRGRAPDALPVLVLLDLKLPRRSGFEVLEWIRATPLTRRVPVVVLTSSRQSADVARAYDLGANSYLVKPVASPSVLEMVRTLNLYWCLMNETSPAAQRMPG
jgi:CheY-like chemotaxis protein